MRRKSKIVGLQFSSTFGASFHVHAGKTMAACMTHRHAQKSDFAAHKWGVIAVHGENKDEMLHDQPDQKNAANDTDQEH